MTLPFTAFADSFASTLLQTLAIGLALTLGAEAILLLAGRLSAASRFRLRATTFLLVASCPLWLELANGSALRSTTMGTTGSTLLTGAPLLHLPARLAPLLLLLWMVAVLYRAAQFSHQLRRVRELSLSSTPVEIDAELPIPAIVASSALVDRPAAIGFLRPRILLPTSLTRVLTPAQLRLVLLHECEHLARLDTWSNLLQKLTLVFMPLHPGLLWLDRQLARDRELACDEAVVRQTLAPRHYAASLASVAEHRLKSQAPALTLGAWHRRPELARRVHLLLHPVPQLSGWTARCLSAATMGVLVATSVAAFQLPRLVSFAPATIAKVSSPVIASKSMASIKPSMRPAALPRGYRMEETAFHSVTERPRSGVMRPSPGNTSRAKHFVRSASALAPRLTRTSATPTDMSTGDATVGTSQAPTADLVGELLVVTTVRAGSAQQTPSPALMNLLLNLQAHSSQPLAVVPTRSGWIVFQL